MHEAVTDEEIAKIISRWTGIPVAKLTESERSKTLHLDEELHRRVIGQDEGVTKVTEAIIRSKAGIKAPRAMPAPPRTYSAPRFRYFSSAATAVITSPR